MKTILLCLCLVLVSCEEKPAPQAHHEVVLAPPPPAPPAPVSTNPFEKPPQPAHEPFQVPHWEQANEFKMNENWTIWTWRDTANHNTCYFYTIAPDNKQGMACVKE